MLKTLFVVTRALFRVLCFRRSVFLFGLCIKFCGNYAATGRISVAVTVGPGCGDWYHSSYSSLSFCVPGEFCIFLLFIRACLLWLVRLVILVTTVIASIVVL